MRMWFEEGLTYRSPIWGLGLPPEDFRNLMFKSVLFWCILASIKGLILSDNSVFKDDYHVISHWVLYRWHGLVPWSQVEDGFEPRSLPCSLAADKHAYIGTQKSAHCNAIIPEMKMKMLHHEVFIELVRCAVWLKHC